MDQVEDIISKTVNNSYEAHNTHSNDPVRLVSPQPVTQLKAKNEQIKYHKHSEDPS
jgi:hypothetical protein